MGAILKYFFTGKMNSRNRLLKNSFGRLCFLLFQLGSFYFSFGQDVSVEFSSSDTALQGAFYRAKEMALSYRGNPTDPVGPWYEAALPSRNAFCIRDVSHQCLAAEVLGLSRETKNMLTRFVSNISEPKDWCTYWEINKFGLPAPEDYRNDSAFWFNLNANFELLYTCWRMYQWTGDTSYITHPAFSKFFALAMNDYVDRWILQANSLLKRPPYPNAPVSFNIDDYFHRCRGLPSYYEAVTDIMMSADLVASIYRAFKSYAAIQALKGNNSAVASLEAKAESYRRHLENYWWDEKAGVYHTYFTNNHAFGNGEGETFLLWYDALKDSSRIRKTIGHLSNVPWNVENLSYLPYQLCRFGYPGEAYRYILYLADPATKRREYPEVSFGVIEGIIQGIMGVTPDANQNRVATLFSGKAGTDATISNLRILSTIINLKQWEKGTFIKNVGEKTITRRATFHGRIPQILVEGKKVKAVQQRDILGNWKSYVDLKLAPGKQVSVEVP
jgi:hypothetical protein